MTKEALINRQALCVADDFEGPARDLIYASTRASLATFWKDRAVIVWTIVDVLDAYNMIGLAVPPPLAGRILDRVIGCASSDQGVAWEDFQNVRHFLDLADKSSLRKLTEKQQDGGTWCVNDRGELEQICT